MTSLAGPDYALLDRIGLSGMMFFPRPDHGAPPRGASDHLIEVAPGVGVAARFYTLVPEHPTVLYFHGNGEVVGDHDPFAQLYHEAGANLFVAEFRGYGKSGGFPTMEYLVSDAHPVAAYFHAILDEGGFSERRFVMGRSLGSQPALEIAARAPERFHGLVLESGAAGLRGLLERSGLGASKEAVLLVAAHEAKIRSVRLSVLQIHGEQDELVPLQSAAELYDLLSGTERELVVIPGAGHNTVLWLGRVRYFEAIHDFISKRASR